MRLTGRLAGRRVLVTRAAGQSSQLAEMLEAESAAVVRVPTIELGPPDSWCALDAALTTVRAYDWVVFTSANAVLAYVARARTIKVPPYARRVAVVGPATARAVVESGLAAGVDLMPDVYTGEALASALVPHVAGAAVLLVRAAVAGEDLPEKLQAAWAQVTIAEAYRNRIPDGSGRELARVFADGGVDAITFTSASTAQNLASLLESAGLAVPAGTVLASIGPVTSQAMRELGMTVTVEAREATIGGLVEALVRGLRLSSS